MAELHVETGPQRGHSLTLSPDTACTVGSKPGCSLQLDAPGVAAQHLVIKALKGGGFGLKALDGTVSINGTETAAARLNEGDSIDLPGVRLRFGNPAAGAATEALGMLGGFRKIEVLGKGGHGTVYRAEQVSLHREVALKVLPTETTQNPEFVGRFVAEARAAARLSHPNVVQVFDVGHDEETYYLSMEIMEEGSLEQRLKRQGGALPVEDCISWMIDAAKGLAYAEQMRIVHRDIKPDNLMLDSHGTVKICDLGLAMGDDQEQGKIVGTPHFMSPEQALNKPLDHRADLYSLGCTFFRLITGRNVFSGKKAKEILIAQVKQEADAADEVNPAVPGKVADIIERLLEKDPEDRYQSAEELVEDLKAALQPPKPVGVLIGIGAVVVLGVGFLIYKVATAPEGGSGGTKIVEKDDPETLRRLRESEARTAFTQLMLQRDKLPVLELAAAYEKFAADAAYSGTAAAEDAKTKAKGLREAEAARIAKAKAAAKALAQAKQGLSATLGAAQQKQDIKAFEQALREAPEQLSAELRQHPEIQAILAEGQKQLDALVDAAWVRLQAPAEDALAKADAEALETALAAIEGTLDPKRGWPAAVVKTRRDQVRAYLKDKRSKIGELKKSAASLAEDRARDRYYDTILGESGVLQLFKNFEVDAAAALLGKLQEQNEGLKAETSGAQMQLVVAAAQRWFAHFRKQVGDGTQELYVPLVIDGREERMRVLGVAGQGADTRLRVRLGTDAKAEEQPILLKEVASDRLRELLPLHVDDRIHDELVAGRLAFLGLHALATHLPAGRAYLARIDPKNDESGIGEDRYGVSLADLNYLTIRVSRVERPYTRYLSHELRAVQRLGRGLQAFSNQRYGAAQGYLQDLQERYPRSLTCRHLRTQG